MSFLSTKAQLVHKSPIPPKTTREQAIELLQDDEFLLSCDPHLAKCEPLIPSTPPTVPSAVEPRVLGETKSYKVTDVIHTLPAGLWDSNVVSTYEFAKLDTGLFVRIRSPLSMVMETVWEIKEGPDGGLEIVENVEISCSRLLIGIAKGQCESAWEGIHGKMLKRLEGSGGVDPA
ncbi:hypothetical protein B0H65DRAFT_447987 [Neurospora tetraspora]|uniref:DUF7053 domain-containing protein n=1 Tax=Neurospora tetraspora TaxID=94610 RepID=A0AAE0MVT8_9PEZI|nr:hypothetical protein B0H65DRAFT_447987 [Neurospora tetraspora]